MNLCIDVGNTRTKFALFEKNEFVLGQVLQPSGVCKQLKEVCERHAIGGVIVASVANFDTESQKYLQERYFYMELNHKTPLPINNCYETPQTLGKDRLAAVVGANALYPNDNALVIDAGTCITYDFITSGGNYLGGGIAPGISTKFKALHTFTKRLPLVESDHLSPSPKVPMTGTNTQESILSGVLFGTLCETDGIIDRYREKYPNLKVLITGGDALFFEYGLKNRIFARPQILMEGLNQILDYNVSKQVQ